MDMSMQVAILEHIEQETAQIKQKLAWLKRIEQEELQPSVQRSIEMYDSFIESQHELLDRLNYQNPYRESLPEN